MLWIDKTIDLVKSPIKRGSILFDLFYGKSLSSCWYIFTELVCNKFHFYVVELAFT